MAKAALLNRPGKLPILVSCSGPEYLRRSCRNLGKADKQLGLMGFSEFESFLFGAPVMSRQYSGPEQETNPGNLPGLFWGVAYAVARRVSSRNAYYRGHPTIGAERRLSLIDETSMGGRFHLLDKTFSNTFSDLLPTSTPTTEQRSRFETPDLSEVKKESDIYSQLKITIDSVLRVASNTNTTPLCAMKTPWHKAADGSNGPRDTIIDAGIYFDTPDARRATELTERDHKRSQLKGEELEKHKDAARRSWHHIVVPIEVKYRLDDAPFYNTGHGARVDKSTKATAAKKAANQTASARRAPDVPSTGKSKEPEPSTVTEEPPPDETLFIQDSKNGEKTLGQLVEYLLNVFKYQHRLFCWAIYVCKAEARLLHVDRTGAFVSNSFEWTNVNSLLHDFVWKIAHMSRDQLGFDPTTTLASPEEKAEINAALADPALHPIIKQHAERAFKSSNGGEANFPIYRVRVPALSPAPSSSAAPDKDEPLPTDEASDPLTSTKDSEFLEYLIGLPHFSAEAVVGRCTKGFIALQLGKRRQFGYMKDFWRPLVPGRTRPEHLIYQRLHAHHVSHIVHLLCAGDVGGSRAQVTRVHRFLQEAAKKPTKYSQEKRAPPVARCHYRLVTEEIGISLMDFKNFKELVCVFLNALTAHREAWERAGILHRDISVGNIMINPATRSGILIDWDVARQARELNQGASEPYRTGTWQFRSALSLLFPWKPYHLSDDIESFVHAFEYLILRFHLTSLRAPLLSRVRLKYDNCINHYGHIKIGGFQKLEDFSSTKSDIWLVRNSKLQLVLDKLAASCHEFYSQVDSVLMEELYGPTRGQQKVEDSEAADEPEEATSVVVSAEYMMDDEAEGETSPSTSQPKSSTTGDPSKLDGFLCSHLALGRVLAKYVQDGLNADKAEDQFEARREAEPELVAPCCHPTMHVSRMSCSHTTTTGDDAIDLAVAGSPIYMPDDPADSGHGMHGDEVDEQSSASDEQRPVHRSQSEPSGSEVESEQEPRPRSGLVLPPSTQARKRGYVDVDVQDSDEDGAVSADADLDELRRSAWSNRGIKVRPAKKKRTTG